MKSGTRRLAGSGPFSVLEEFGVPMPLTEKLGLMVRMLPESVDDILQFMNSLDYRKLDFSDLEMNMLSVAFPREDNLFSLKI